MTDDKIDEVLRSLNIVECFTPNAIDRAIFRAGMQQATEREDVLLEALCFYADPCTYHACCFLFDPPTGGFDDDFSFDEDYQRDMPGKRARTAIANLADKYYD